MLGLGTVHIVTGTVSVTEIRCLYPTVPFFGTLLSVITKTFISVKK